jgi:2-polyprenyl-6-methoxyphenol hydroxylase-like FAD-dependent oxidoreductase
MNNVSTAARTTSPLQIIIIGAGIGGLTLANLLLQANPAIGVRIFERDSSAHARTQGGTLGLKQHGGLDALQRLGMNAAIRAMSQPVTEFTIQTCKGKHLLTLHGNPHSLRVPRVALRDFLFRNVHQMITFDMFCTGYTVHQGKPVVRFTNGCEATADVVVACDGVKSAIRQQLIGDQPHFLGLSAISGGVVTTESHPQLAKGPLLVIGEGVSLILDQQQNSIGWSLTLRTKPKELDALPASVLQERVLALTRHWCSPIRDIVCNTQCEEIASLGGFYDKNPLRQHARAGTLVLLGDAAHPMSPFRGEGANMAMLDALSFVEALQTAREGQLIHVLAHYEQEMLVRTRKAVLQSRRAAKEIHSRNPATRALLRGKLRLANRFLTPREPRETERVGPAS